MEDRKQSEIEKELTFRFRHIGKEMPADIAAADAFCEGYKQYLNEGKTERECVRLTESMAVKEGYAAFDREKEYKAGDRVYYNNRGKNITLITFGKKPLDAGVRFNIAHIDSPRLDLKPNPLYEQDELSYFKTHYYGGIRKYQWGVTPLAMHGTVVLKDGTVVPVCLGEKEGEPQFVISDLLPHLSGKQDQRTLKQGLSGEELNIILGSLP